MPRRKGCKEYRKFLEELGFNLNDESVRKDLEIFEKAHQEAKKLGLDKLTMEEIDEIIKKAREEAAKEAKEKEKAKV